MTDATPVPWWRRGPLFEIVETVAVTLVLFLVIQAFIAQPYQVEGDSMERTVEPQQYVLVDKLSPRFDAYHRGDIVVFRPPEGFQRGDTPFIKRVIGVAGDEVELRDGGVVVNGTAIDEPYAYADPPGSPPEATISSGPTSWQVPDGAVFLLGDHRTDSEDSRVFGPVSTSQVLGRAWLRYWPLSAFGPV
jgi:signal peptidase I